MRRKQLVVKIHSSHPQEKRLKHLVDTLTKLLHDDSFEHEYYDTQTNRETNKVLRLPMQMRLGHKSCNYNLNKVVYATYFASMITAGREHKIVLLSL